MERSRPEEEKRSGKEGLGDKETQGSRKGKAQRSRKEGLGDKAKEKGWAVSTEFTVGIPEGCYTVNNFPYGIIKSADTVVKIGNAGQTGRRHYKDVCCAFDIETSWIKEIDQSVMYIWQFDGYYKEEHYTVIGRTWEEFKFFIKELDRVIKEGDTLLIFVHNLSYEFCWLKGLFNILPEQVFCLDRRKVAKYVMNKKKIEFRCSYVLTNDSLDHFTEVMKVKHAKLEGYDYSKVRYGWTPLTEFEYNYCINDVKGLTEAIVQRNISTGDNLATVPLTMTGYVRRNARRAMYAAGLGYRDQMPTLHQYELLQHAFRGGNTHANRYISGSILPGVESVDGSSFYPAQMLTRKYPMHKFREVDHPNFDVVNELLDKGKALLILVRFEGLELSDPYEPIPYISTSKSVDKLPHNVLFDNGRLLSGDITLCLTDLDYKIIAEQYDWDFERSEVLELWQTSYNWLPIQYRSLVYYYYKQKTALKGTGRDIDYAISKEQLNSLYGMMVQDPLKDMMLYRQDEPELNGGFVEEGKDISKLYDEYLRKGWLPYQWGVWCTAWARYSLQEGINLVKGSKNAMMVYCDTDSIKYIGNVDFTGLNKKIRKRAKEAEAVATDAKGKDHYIGEMEPDASYDKFVTLGAKKYAFEIGNKLGITVAGIPKIKGSNELAQMGGLKYFTVDTYFDADKIGKTTIKYNDAINMLWEDDGHVMEIHDNAVIKPAPYRIGMSSDYMALLLKNRQVTTIELDNLQDLL